MLYALFAATLELPHLHQQLPADVDLLCSSSDSSSSPELISFRSRFQAINKQLHKKQYEAALKECDTILSQLPHASSVVLAKLFCLQQMPTLLSAEEQESEVIIFELARSLYEHTKENGIKALACYFMSFHVEKSIFLHLWRLLDHAQFLAERDGLAQVFIAERILSLAQTRAHQRELKNAYRLLKKQMNKRKRWVRKKPFKGQGLWWWQYPSAILPIHHFKDSRSRVSSSGVSPVLSEGFITFPTPPQSNRFTPLQKHHRKEKYI